MSEASIPTLKAPEDDRVEWLRITPFIALHVGCLLVFVAGWSATALIVAAALYIVRMFGITAFYHRYFSHRTFRTSRWAQFLFAVLGNSAAQKGPLWWAAHHRKHHKHADTPRDSHSPIHRAILWAHMGWFTTASAYRTDMDQVRDLAKYPELRFLDKFDALVPVLLAAALFGVGEVLAATTPSLGTNGLQLLAWGFFVSTTVLFHVTSLVNSAGHMLGSRRYETRDHSRNSAWLAVLTLGEGWHNNHHHYPVAARQGFFWWEFDPTYYTLRLMQRIGLIRELRTVPAWARDDESPRRKAA